MALKVPQRHNSDFANNLKQLILKRASKTTEAPPPSDHKALDVQVITGDLENLLKTMDQADARVQRAVAKLNELKTAIMLATDKG